MQNPMLKKRCTVKLATAFCCSVYDEPKALILCASDKQQILLQKF